MFGTKTIDNRFLWIWREKQDDARLFVKKHRCGTKMGKILWCASRVFLGLYDKTKLVLRKSMWNKDGENVRCALRVFLDLYNKTKLVLQKSIWNKNGENEKCASRVFLCFYNNTKLVIGKSMWNKNGRNLWNACRGFFSVFIPKRDSFFENRCGTKIERKKS